MRISVIIPIYNSESKLERTIKSILSQIYQNWELVLIDDGSSDNSGNICDKYAAADNRIKVFHTQNGGVSKARNLGLSVSTGDWVTFCDSDDELFPNALNSYLSAINDNVDLIRGGFVRTKGRSIDRIATRQIVSSDKENIIKICALSKYEAYIWNSCFRRRILLDIRFNESITWCEDHLFTFRAISKSRAVVFIPDLVYKYNAPIKGDNSCSNNLSNRYLAPDLIIQEAVEERNIKIEMCGKISNECLNLVNDEFDYKIKLALRYSVLGNKYILGINICRKYRTMYYMQYASLILHIKILPTIRNYIRLLKSKF